MEEEKSFVIKNFMDRLGKYILLFAGYIFIPSIVAAIFYKKFRFSDMGASFVGNLSFVVILILIYYNMFEEKIKDFIQNRHKYMKDGFKYWGYGLLVMYIANIILVTLVFSDIAANEEVNRSIINEYPFLGMLSVTFLAPFVEEMIFRYGLKEVCPNTKYYPLISALVFGVPHALTGMSTSMTVFENLIQLLYVIPYGALGYAFGYIYKKTDNIYVSMSMHAIHNFLCFVIIMGLA